MMAQFKNNMTGGMTMALVLTLGLLSTGAQAEDCQVPLFVQQAAVGANVMIIADNSGSMNAGVYHPDYNPSNTYSGNFNSGSTYYISSDGWREPRDFNWFWPNSPSVYLVNSDNGERGRYIGNYLNWLYFHATDAQRADAPRVTRIQVLKEVLVEIVNRSEKLDIGLTIFNHSDGGRVIAPCGVDHDDLVDIVEGISADTWTPLGETTEVVARYFMDSSRNAPITAHCQQNFCIVVTDGLPTMDRHPAFIRDEDGDGREPGSCASIGAPYSESNDCSDYFDDATYFMAHEDLRDDLENDQHVNTYVVGFRERGNLIQEAAFNGDGLFFFAENAVEMVMSIEFALQDILRRISAGSAVAVVSTERGTDDRLYRGKFMPEDWTGFLECYALPYEEGDPAIWEAGQLLKSRLDSGYGREIFTAIDDDAMPFSSGSAVDLQSPMGTSSLEETIDLITWAQGNNVSGLRDREGWVLGDIVHSTPVVVGTASTFDQTESFRTYFEYTETRDKIVYVGANDGMIHAFNAYSGSEEWAFVPEFALPKFSAMADSGYCHLYTCDQTVTVKDIQVGGTWRTILISGGREGGGHLFALDVTYPGSPQVLWQRALPDGALPFESEVEIVSIGGRAVALVGSGLDQDDQRAYIHSYDVASGDLIGSEELEEGLLRNKAGRPAVVDFDLDGETDFVYVADLSSRIWRFETGGDPDPSAWDKSLLYNSDQEITAPLVASFGENGEVLIYFGTGAYLTEDDMLTIDQHSFICVKDVHNEVAVDKADLVDQTSDIDPVDDARGWYVDLWMSEGERVTQEAAVVAGTVIFTSFSPSLDPCVAGGTSYLYQMAYDNGGVPEVEGMEDPEDRAINLGDGIASHPVVDLAQGTVVVQSSDASISVTPIAGLVETMTVRSWQETFDIPDQEGTIEEDLQ
jgi:type IV pilus assembly protein PilY1